MIRVLLLLSLVAAPAFAAKKRVDCGPTLVPALVERTFSKAKDFEGGVSVTGRFSDMSEPAFLGYVQYGVDVEGGKAILELNRVDVVPEYRGRGVQTMLYEEMLRRTEKKYGVVQLKVYNLVDTNGEVYYEALTKRTVAAFPELKMPELEESVSDPWARRFEECCLGPTRGNPKRVLALAWESFLETPAYKTRAKFGYAKRCPGGPFEISVYGSIRVHLCK